MKIALAHSFSLPEPRRASERLVDDLATYLRERGLDIDVYCGTPRHSLFYRGPRGRDYRLRIPRSRLLEGYGVLGDELFGIRTVPSLAIHRYDVVHCFTPTAVLAATAVGSPTVYSVADEWFPSGLPPRRLGKEIEALALARATTVVVSTDAAAAAVEEACGRRPSVLPPGIFVDWWRPGERPHDQAPTVFFPGRTTVRTDGIALLIAALVRLVRRYGDIRLRVAGSRLPDWVIGETAGAERLAESIDTLAIETTYDLRDAYATADVTVLPVLNDPSASAALESLSCGVPLAAGARDGASPFVTPYVGASAQVGDVDDLVAAVETCLQRARDDATAERCRSHAAAFDWSKVGPAYEDVYASTACGRARPDGSG